jgi:ABC-type transport system involved in multi-copper enzyme maturation permease subunit
MRCLIWRQHRGQLLATVSVLAAACLLMVVVAHSANQWLNHYQRWLVQLRAAGCPVPGSRQYVTPSSCHALLSRYSGGEQSSFVHAYNFTIAVFEEGLVLLLVILGALIGAPLVAREVEQRTQLVAWTQSIPRRRWYATKTVVLATGLTVAGLIAGLANDVLQVPLTRGGLTSSRWPWFFSIDITPAAEILLAFALAVAMGAYLRRTLAAVGAALVAYLALFLLTGWAVRSLTPLSDSTSDRGVPNNSWIIGGGHYHPSSQYWPLQLTYVAILLLLAAALFVAGWRATRPRNVV